MRNLSEFNLVRVVAQGLMLAYVYSRRCELAAKQETENQTAYLPAW